METERLLSVPTWTESTRIAVFLFLSLLSLSFSPCLIFFLAPSLSYHFVPSELPRPSFFSRLRSPCPLPDRFPTGIISTMTERNLLSWIT
ncbi:hypothetical protein PUN28_019268 [Cardiocondyla obscurior]|uniref:Uncharacterized protein n=1 Tax=Cardiocondyla obscurior TaxID=286306 RepID=A0AAW2EEL5_9HYME